MESHIMYLHLSHYLQSNIQYSTKKLRIKTCKLNEASKDSDAN